MALATVEKRPFGALGRMGVVAALHVAVLFVIARSLGLTSVTVEEGPMKGDLYDQPAPNPEPPPKIEYVPERTGEVTLPVPIVDPLPYDSGETSITAKLVEPDLLGDTSGSAEPEHA